MKAYQDGGERFVAAQRASDRVLGWELGAPPAHYHLRVIQGVAAGLTCAPSA